MALAHFSGGCCYCPGCPEPVLREVDGKIHFTVQIAHICAASRGGPRFDDTMTDNQRRDLPNLLLLCGLCRRRHKPHRRGGFRPRHRGDARGALHRTPCTC